MATYRQIHTHIWDDPKFEELSPHAKLLFIYGFSNKHRNEAGLYSITVRKIAFETGLTPEQATDAIKEIEKLGMWRYDWDNHVLWVKNALKYQSVSEKCLVAIRKDIDSINSPLTDEFKEYYKGILYPSDTLSIGYPNPSDTLAGNGNGNNKNNNKKNNNKNNIIILQPDEAEFLEVLETVPGYPFDRKKDLEMLRRLKERYPQLDHVESIKDWREYKADHPLTPKDNPRSQINTAFKKYVEWGKNIRAPAKNKGIEHPSGWQVI